MAILKRKHVALALPVVGVIATFVIMERVKTLPIVIAGTILIGVYLAFFIMEAMLARRDSIRSRYAGLVTER